MIQWRLTLHLDCREALRNIGIDGANIFMPEEIKVIPCNNELESLGIIVKANDFIRRFTTCVDETFDNTYDCLSKKRGGSFDCNKKYFLINNDCFYVGAFVHVGYVAHAEIWSNKRNCIVAYVRM